MKNSPVDRSHLLAFRILCLFMAGLTACSSARPQYVWHDAASQRQPGMTKPAQIMESWGRKPQGPDVTDPDIAPGFLLALHCLADSKLSGDYRVGFNGDLELPYDMTVNTKGMTLLELKKKLTDVYRPYFKTPSDIDVRIKERRYWVEVRGLVEKPGRYLVEPEASLDLIIGLAGGVSKETPPLYVRIQKGEKVFIFDLNRYYAQGEDRPQILGWLGGEFVFFQKEVAGSQAERSASSAYHLPVYITGEVRKPGEYLMNPGSDFIDSLMQAGGFTERADLDNIEIVRRTGGRKRVFGFSWDEFQRAPAPQPGDVIYIHADNTSKSERKTVLFATILSAMASAVTAAVLVLSYNRNKI